MSKDVAEQSVMVLGRDITKIPCMRQSILYSIGIGFAAGLGGFLFTSRPKLACHIAVGTYTASTLLIFTYCRLERALNDYRKDELGDYIATQAILESTEMVPVKKLPPILDDV